MQYLYQNFLLETALFALRCLSGTFYSAKVLLLVVCIKVFVVTYKIKLIDALFGYHQTTVVTTRRVLERIAVHYASQRMAWKLLKGKYPHRYKCLDFDI